MRSVPNPSLPAVRFGGGVTARGLPAALGATTGVLAGASLWGLTYREIGWVGVLFPLAGAVAGMYVWSATAR